uniref:Uncharacterized protein LOC111123950 isoform X2 n=1 Tax=Crassostrea virginica TaxID=6565 RepID=A0A8B8D3W3_CRAVI|nr:uncharacterized protein LOC111123950 isoform X2 [Crassostrea virginica]
MPPRKSHGKKITHVKLQPEISSDDDLEIEISEIKEGEDDGSGNIIKEGEDDGSGNIHPDNACQSDNVDEKAGDSTTNQRDIPGGSRSSSTPSAVKITKHTKERADKELVKSPVPYWSDPNFWIPVLGIIQIITIITSVYVFDSMRNSLENLKSCQKRDPATDISKPCADCTCIATDGFSSKECSNIIERQSNTEEKYRLYENSVKDVQRKLSANDDMLSGFKRRDTIITQQFEKLNAKIEEFSNNPIIGDENVIAMCDREWEKRQDILMKAFDSRESFLKDILDKKIQETEAKLNTELEQMIKSKIGLQFQEINKNIEEQMRAVKNMMKNDTSGFKENFERVDEQINSIFREIDNLNNIIVCVFLLVVIGGIFVAYKFLISRKDSFNTIIEKLKRKGLKKGLLVVSFLPSTHQFHLDALNAVPEFKQTSPVKVLVQRFDDIMDVQPHKVVIIFVDFNNRNIILENEETEIGDLRNQTTKMFLSLKCDVLVVYCKDKGSQDLPPENLYNPRLHSIDRQPVLSELKNKKRVLSINDKFHPHQVEHLKSCCQQL